MYNDDRSSGPRLSAGQMRPGQIHLRTSGDSASRGARRRCSSPPLGVMTGGVTRPPRSPDERSRRLHRHGDDNKQPPSQRQRRSHNPAEPADSDPTRFLPTTIFDNVILLRFVPLPQFLALRCVSRRWRAYFSRPDLYRTINLSASSGLLTPAGRLLPGCVGPRLPHQRRPGNCCDLLVALTHRGGVTSLDVSGVYAFHSDTLMDVLRRNLRSLRTLRMLDMAPPGDQQRDAPHLSAFATSTVLTLLKVAPQLDLLEVDVRCARLSELQDLLRGPLPRAARGIRALCLVDVSADFCMSGILEMGSMVQELRAALENGGRDQHPWLPRRLRLFRPFSCNSVAAAALTGQLTSLEMAGAAISPCFLEPLAAVLRGDRALRELLLSGSVKLPKRKSTHVARFVEIFGAPPPNPPHDPDAHTRARALTNLFGGTSSEETSSFDEFCAALRSSALESLRLRNLDAWAFPQMFAEVLAALREHATLADLDLSGNDVQDGPIGEESDVQRAAGEALSALVAADSPALRALDVSGCGFSAATLGAVFDALQLNSHLRVLKCRQQGDARTDAGFDEAFARRRVLPAVLACDSLRELDWDWHRAPADVEHAISRELQRRGLADAAGSSS